VIALLCALVALALAIEPQIEPSALASALAATRTLRHRRRQRDAVSDADIVAAQHDPAACFRGFQIGHSYHYKWTTSMDATKVAVHETKRSEHTRTVLLSLEGIVTPLATDDSGRLTSKLEIVAASVSDSRGWSDYIEEDVSRTTSTRTPPTRSSLRA
jgi:hypothetical protein